MLDRLTDRAGEAIENLGKRMQGEETYHKLVVEPPRGSGWFGFGKKVVVPSDQVHIVAAAGLHSLFASREVVVYGGAATENVADSTASGGTRIPSAPHKTAGIIYRKNSLTNVIAMRTITFLVSVDGVNGQGIKVLDSNRVPYIISAHVVAKLDETRADIAARRVGTDIESLATTIREVTEAELTDAAAGMALEELLHKAQVLAEKAFDSVKETLQELGYTLVLLKVSDLGGDAYQKLVAQANADVLRSSTIAINASELATGQNQAERERTEAQVIAQTRRVTEREKLTADRDVKTSEATIAEELATQQHDLALKQAERQQIIAQTQQGVALKQVDLDKAVDLAETQRAAEVEARKATLTAANELATATAEAERLAIVQAKQLEREAELSASRLDLKAKEEAAAADRAGTTLTTQAQAEADALKIKTTAETQAEQTKASAKAQAATSDALAELELAKAKRASAAAPGLAEADVQARQVEIADQRVKVTRAEGLAQIEVLTAKNKAELDHTQGLRDIEIKAQQTLAALYEGNPALVELERFKLELAHRLQIAQLENQSRVAMMAALAPQMNLHLIGDGGRASQIMAQIMNFSNLLEATGEQVPVLGNLLSGAGLNGNGHADTNGVVNSIQDVLGGLVPYITKVVRGMEPRVFTTLTVSQMLDRLTPVVRGEANLLQAIDGIRQDAHFQVIGNLPVAPLLAPLGITIANEQTDDSVVAAAH